MSERCCGEVWGKMQFRPVRCSRSGKLEHEGRFYCAAHHPPTVTAKNKVRHDKWEEDFSKSRDKYKRAALAENLLARFTTVELENAVAVDLITTPEPAPELQKE